MKRLIILVLALFVAVSLGLMAHRDPGYVLFGYGAWTVESSLSLFFLVLVFTLFVFYYLVRSYLLMRYLPQKARYWRRARRIGRTGLSTTKGMIALTEGRWQAAEKLLLRHVESAESPLLNYLGAANAAQQLAAYDRRDQYLILAHESMPSADLAVGLSQARLQMDHQQWEQALATLIRLRELAPKHSYVLKLLIKLYVQLKEWDKLVQVLPEARRAKSLSPADTDALEVRSFHELLIKSMGRQSSIDQLHRTWQRIPERLKDKQVLLAQYIQGLINFKEEHLAEPLLRKAIKQRWDNYWVYLYGMISGNDPKQQLLFAESWLRDNPSNDILLLTLGRLSLRNRLYGKAQDFFRNSLNSKERPETLQELGKLLEQMGEEAEAMECYRRGLSLVPDVSIEAKGRTVGFQGDRRVSVLSEISNRKEPPIWQLNN